MSLTRWEPFRDFRELDSFDRIVDNFFGRPQNGTRQAREQSWRPATDIVADDSGYEFRFDLPGVAKDDIEIAIEDGTLTVTGERHYEKKEGEESSRYFKSETFRGSFRRSFRLPDDADVSEVNASHNDGVLEVVVAKSPAAKARKIPIATSGEGRA